MLVVYDDFSMFPKFGGAHSCRAPYAWCLPGNRALISTGYLVFCRNEEQVPAVLGHEIGHRISRHLGEDRSYKNMQTIPRADF